LKTSFENHMYFANSEKLSDWSRALDRTELAHFMSALAQEAPQAHLVADPSLPSFSILLRAVNCGSRLRFE
jgi:hypothetical protein